MTTILHSKISNVAVCCDTLDFYPEGIRTIKEADGRIFIYMHGTDQAITISQQHALKFAMAILESYSRFSDDYANKEAEITISIEVKK